MGRLQRALDDEWETFRSSSAGAGALARWRADDGRYLAFTDLADLRSSFECRKNPSERDGLLADLLRRCPDDAVARRLLLAVLRPGLRRLTRRASAFWDPDEAESIVIAAAVDRLADRTIGFPVNPAAGVLGSVWKAVWERRSRERWEEDYWGGRANPEILDEVAAPPAADAELLCIVDEAVRRGAVPAKGARLVVLHWIHGYTNAELAAIDGLRPCTIRKHRRQAELLLAEFAA